MSADGEGSPHGPDEPHMSFVQHAPNPQEVQRVFSTYWMPLLKGGDGPFNIERLKGELYDAWFLVNEARKVYRHATGGLTDDLTASADGIIAMMERRIDRRIYAAVTRGEAPELAPIGWPEAKAFLESVNCLAVAKERLKAGLKEGETALPVAPLGWTEVNAFLAAHDHEAVPSTTTQGD